MPAFVCVFECVCMCACVCAHARMRVSECVITRVVIMRVFFFPVRSYVIFRILLFNIFFTSRCVHLCVHIHARV